MTETRSVAKPGSGVADIVASAGYDPSCANAATCNQPNTTTDPRGNVTTYSYDASTGNVTSVAAPAAASGGTGPTTSYAYTTVNGAAVLSSTSVCQTNASCAGTADQAKEGIS